MDKNLVIYYLLMHHVCRYLLILFRRTFAWEVNIACRERSVVVALALFVKVIITIQSTGTNILMY